MAYDVNYGINGGFPFTQKRLDDLQKGYQEGVEALLSVLGAHDSGVMPNGVILWGMEETVSGADHTISEGWWGYDGKVYYCPGGTLTLSGGEVVDIVPNDTTPTNLTYFDGVTHEAVGTYTRANVQVASSALHPYAAMPRAIKEPGWHSISVATDTAVGNVVGTIYYKKNFFNNTLHIRAELNANAAHNFSAGPYALNYLMGTLPSGYRPASATVYFTTYYFASNLFQDDANVQYIKQLTSAINTSGDININFLKPESSVTAYSVTFNCVVPLD